MVEDSAAKKKILHGKAKDNSEAKDTYDSEAKDVAQRTDGFWAKHAWLLKWLLFPLS